ncbi:MAG: hypothetical protein GF398_09590 [Chitinivibrionales bacterium]|nr:hypothetical protein [Chitinivibrionales bacterium]
MRKPQCILNVLIPAICLFTACTEKYNPFSDYRNAGIRYTTRTIKSGDTLDVFSAETLAFVVTVKELMQQVRLQSSGNRLWPNGDTVLTSPFDQEPHTFLLSYHDTGFDTVVAQTFRTDATIEAETTIVFVTSLLHQDSVTSFIGDSVQLKTPCVSDRDVTYYWNFGAGTPFGSQVCSIRVTAASALLFGTGALWVSDGIYASPADSFNFMLKDTSLPDIRCVNDNFIGRDTIYTSDTFFTFKARITDGADLWVDSASVNGEPFDRQINKIYYKLFTGMNRYDASSPLGLTVYALDHFAFGNEHAQSFWIIFDDSAQSTDPVEISRISPAADSTVTSNDTFTISGTIINNAAAAFSIVLRAENNGLVISPDTMLDTANSHWSWDLVLDTGVNTVRLTAVSKADSDSLASSAFVIIYQPEAPDTLAPRILSATANGKPAQGYYTSSSTVLFGVKAIDDGVGMDSLYVNGDPLAPSSPGSRWFYATVPLQHITSGNEIVVRLVDRIGNAKQTPYVIYRNRLGFLELTPDPAFIETDSLYADSVRAIDPDGDSLVYAKSDGPASLSVSAGGHISWLPHEADTGVHKVTIRIWDGFQPVFVSYTLYVSGPGNPNPGPVLFKTKAADFPLYLEADLDTLQIQLEAIANSGIPPYTWSARIDHRDSLLLEHSSSNLLVWAPGLVDVGQQQIIGIVTDAFPNSDTIYPSILVVPPNRPCSLSVAFHADTSSGNVADVNRRQAADTLVFRIHDPDPQLAERHDVVIFQSARSQLMSTIDSALVDSFSVVVDPRLLNGFDTVTAVLTDGANHSDTLKQAIYYGMPPFAPLAVHPMQAAAIPSGSVTLSWQSSDVDNDSLWYDVYLGTNPQQLPLLATLSQASYSTPALSGPATYYWKVVVHDWKSYTDGAVWQFQTQP